MYMVYHAYMFIEDYHKKSLMFKYGRMPNYSLAGQILECVNKEHSYLGIILEQPMTFTSHINHTVSKASKVLNFLKQNLHDDKCST